MTFHFFFRVPNVSSRGREKMQHLCVTMVKDKFALGGDIYIGKEKYLSLGAIYHSIPGYQ